MRLERQLNNICYADFDQLVDMDEESVFKLYNLMKRLEEFFKERSSGT